MQKLFLKHKSLITLFVFVGFFAFSVCHASVMPQSMDGMDCHAQRICVACPVSVASESPALSISPTPTDVILENPPHLPDPLRDSFYHPPR